MIQKITSTTNDLIKETAKLQQKKYREEKKLFIAEGQKAIDGLLNTGFEVEKIFVKEDLYNIYEKANIKNIIVVNDAVMAKISDTKTPCSVLAVVKQKCYKLNDFFNFKKIILLENIKDAGNLGTILRSCKAFGINGILLSGDTIDLYNPKVIRATVGCFDIPTIKINYNDTKKFKHNLYSTALYEKSKNLSEIKFTEPFIIAFGSEADGLSEDFKKLDAKNFKIEMQQNVESLNLANAVSICLYKQFTQTT